MDLLVYNGAMCMCSFGTAPCPLVILPTSNSEKRCATMMDYNFINLQSFGMCTSMENPSVAAITAAALGALTPSQAALLGTVSISHYYLSIISRL